MKDSAITLGECYAYERLMDKALANRGWGCFLMVRPDPIGACVSVLTLAPPENPKQKYVVYQKSLNPSALGELFGIVCNTDDFSDWQRKSPEHLIGQFVENLHLKSQPPEPAPEPEIEE